MPLSSSDKTRSLPNPAALPLPGAHLGARCPGLTAAQVDADGGRFEALDGTAIIIRRGDDPSLPPALGPTPSLRETIYGVASTADLEAIVDELGRDREVRRDENGALHSVDDLGFAIAFQVSWRRAFEAPADLTNAPGSAPQRPLNQLGITPDIEVERAKVTREKSEFDGFKEADLQGHLANGNGGQDRPTASGKPPEDRPQDGDYQLSQALSLLKGLSVSRGNN